MRRYIALFVLLLPLTGCAAQDALIAQRSRAALVGLNKTQLLMCAGHPDATDDIPGGQVWMYAHGAVPPAGLSLAAVPLPFGSGLSVVSAVGSGYCRVQFKLMKNVVTQVSYAGATYIMGARDAACAPIVRNCLGTATRH